MQRVSSENQGECWHAKSRKRMKERETAVGVEKRIEKPLHVVNLYNALEQR
jgi:hypothetical protein